MTPRAALPRCRADFHAAQGVLLVVRPPPAAAPPVRGQPATVPSNPAEGVEILLAVWDDGSVSGLHGHVDLGTGLQTALAQLVAEELEVALPAGVRGPVDLIALMRLRMARSSVTNGTPSCCAAATNSQS
jgi:hypothetical protein